jgi:hypothetical protein
MGKEHRCAFRHVVIAYSFNVFVYLFIKSGDCFTAIAGLFLDDLKNLFHHAIVISGQWLNP